jgi:hypothetical protein
MIILYPNEANLFAIANPNPEVVPVINAIFVLITNCILMP